MRVSKLSNEIPTTCEEPYVARGFETLNVSVRYALGNDLCCCEFSASIGRGCLEARSFAPLPGGHLNHEESIAFQYDCLFILL